MAFVQRLVTASFQLASGTFPGGGNSATVSGLRMAAEIVKGGTFAATAHLRVWGMPLALMNQLSTLGQAVKLVQANTVTINAGDTSMSGSLPAIFTGTVNLAWVDWSAQPQVAFDVTAFANGFEAVNTIKPTSFPNGGDLAMFLQTLAGQMNLTLENNGVAGSIAPSSYFPGTAWEQARKASVDYNFNIFPDLGKLVIWPKDKTRTSLPVPTISKSTGMITSPIYTNTGIIIKTLFNPNVTMGSQIQVQSDVATPANGTWGVFSVAHALETQVPKGQWFTTIEAYALNAPTPMAVAP